MPTRQISLPQGVSASNASLGSMFFIGAMVVFATQDGISKYLALTYSVFFIVMIRYWAFGFFVLALSARKPGGIRAVARSAALPVQIFRGVLLVIQICCIVWSFSHNGLINTHSVFASYPLMVTALSVPLLGERVGLRRWLAICVGFVGVLIILQPGSSIFSPASLYPLGFAVMFALYNIATRYVARVDRPETSFFWTGISGAVTITLIGPFYWDPMQTSFDWMWMGILSVTGTLGHYLMIRALDLTEASRVQPFVFLQTAFASGIGIIIFAEELRSTTILGTSIVVASGLFTLWREQLIARKATSSRSGDK